MLSLKIKNLIPVSRYDNACSVLSIGAKVAGVKWRECRIREIDFAENKKKSHVGSPAMCDLERIRTFIVRTGILYSIH